MYVLLGAHGNITSRAARALLQRRHPVRVIGRNAATLAPLQQLGAQLAIGDAQDTSFLARTFEGAAAVYAMIPPDYGAADMRRSQALFGTAIAGAIAQSGVRRVVNLSSVGADLPSGTGPIAGLHEQEQRLDALPGLDLLHLRPGYFMENHLHAAGAVAALGVYPSLESPDVEVPMVATADIAAVVVRELVQGGSRGVLHLHAPRRYTFRQAASILGGAIGRPDLPYVQVEPEQGMAAMMQLGFSPDAAGRMAEMARWLSAGTHATLPGPAEVTPTTLEDFAPRFREAFDALPRTAAA
ncbi:MAG: NAD(P)H-binding protein [Rubrivivax sp.]|nr:NAD(P)H-binding protein [Rubrivivax sp.]